MWLLDRLVVTTLLKPTKGPDSFCISCLLLTASNITHGCLGTRLPRQITQQLTCMGMGIIKLSIRWYQAIARVGPKS
ncbi:hypothetical protein IWX91DRAFT_334593 [Phyllosticta citricarpa]